MVMTQRIRNSQNKGKHVPNTQRGYLESWNGTQWVLAAGGGESVTEEYAENINSTLEYNTPGNNPPINTINATMAPPKSAGQTG